MSEAGTEPRSDVFASHPQLEQSDAASSQVTRLHLTGHSFSGLFEPKRRTDGAQRKSRSSVLGRAVDEEYEESVRLTQSLTSRIETRSVDEAVEKLQSVLGETAWLERLAVADGNSMKIGV